MKKQSNQVAAFIGRKESGQNPYIYKLAGDASVSIGNINASGTVTISISGVVDNELSYDGLLFWV